MTVPIATFNHPGTPRLGRARIPIASLDALNLALRSFDPFETAASRGDQIAEIAAKLNGVYRCVYVRHGGATKRRKPASPTQEHFRIRFGELAYAQEATECARVLKDALYDLVDVPIAGSDAARLVAATSCVIETHFVPGEEATDAEGLSRRASVRREPAREEMWNARWIIGHQLHALFNISATRALDQSIDFLKRDRIELAIEQVDVASCFVRAFAPARAQALAVPATFYLNVLRPEMMPPETAKPLSGRMHIEYRTYREALGRFIDSVPQPLSEMAATQPDLAFARERLLEADLTESERHVTLVEPIVEDARSIVQSPLSRDNAVSSLRRIRDERSKRAEPFVRFGSADRT